MFLEGSKATQQRTGWIEVICGSMFSGKTEELIRRLKRAKFAKQRVEIFKPDVDTRYSDDKVVSHDANEIHSTPVPSSSNITLMANEVDVVGIDEAQFFDTGLSDVCNQLANSGIRVIVAGLDMDFRGIPFESMSTIMACAEHVTKLHAICLTCGAVANYSYRLADEQELIHLGEVEAYQPLCRTCFNKVKRKDD